MPGIRALCCQWLLAPDDGIFAGILDSIAYFPWTIWCCFKTYDWFHLEGRYLCNNALLQDIAFGSFSCAMILQWFLAIGMVYFSTRGTMREGAELRHPFEFLFGIKTIIVILGPLWLAFAGYIFLTDDFCDFSRKKALMIASAFQLPLSVAQLSLWWVTLDGKRSSAESRTEKKTVPRDFFLCSAGLGSAYQWKLRLLTLFLLGFPISKSMRHTLKSIYEIFAYIPRELDIVYTDFAVGVVLLGQKYLNHHKKENIKTDSSPAAILQNDSPASQFPTTDIPAWMNLLLAKRHFGNILDAFPVCCNMFQSEILEPRNIRDYLTMKSYTSREDCIRNMESGPFNEGSRYKDFVHVSFHKTVYFIPFCLHADNSTSSIVIVVGGVMSTSDMLIDAITKFSSMEEDESLHDVFGHSGILKAAKSVNDKLNSNGVFVSAVNGRKNYHLVTAGHNLGASVAAVLAMLLRQSNPSVRCFAFEPIPCIFFENLETTSDTVFSVVFGNAVIPYLSFHDVEHMVKQILKSAQECSLSKYKVFFQTPPEADETSPLREEILTSISPENNSTPEKRVSTREADPGGSKVSKKSPIKLATMTKLYIPGRVLHIKHGNKRCRLEILTAKDFPPPMILPDMAIRHSSQYIKGLLEQLGRTYTLPSATEKIQLPCFAVA